MGGGLEKISHVLVEEARRERDGILEASRKKAESIIKEAEKDSESKKKEILEQARREAAAFRENELAKARMDARVALLNAKDALADDAFGQALAVLSGLKKKKGYAKMVSDMVCRAALEGDGELIVSGEDSLIFTKGFLTELNSRLAKKKARVSLSKEKRAMSGGLVLSYPEKGIELNRSFEALLLESKERNLPKVAKILFEGE